MKRIIFVLGFFLLFPSQSFSQNKFFMGVGLKAKPIMVSIPIYSLNQKSGYILEMNVTIKSVGKGTDVSDVQDHPFSWWKENNRENQIILLGFGYLDNIARKIFLKMIFNFGIQHDAVQYYSTASETYFILHEKEKYVFGGELGLIFIKGSSGINIGLSYPGILHLSYDFNLIK